MILDKKLVDSLYEKGLMVDVCGYSDSEGYKPTHVQVRTVQERTFTLETWESIKKIIQLVLNLKLEECEKNGK